VTVSAPAISPISPVGSTRIQHTYIDWTQLTNGQYSNMGPGQTPPWAQDRINLSGTGPARGGAWANMSGVNKQNGLMMDFLQASSFNIGEFSTAIIPCVGRNPAAKSPTYLPSETQQYWAWNFQIAQGGGVAQSGYTPINPPYAAGSITLDVGVFFFVQDFNKSASSYLQFSDNGGVDGAEYGFGFFLDSNGEWHYGIRYSKTGTSVPLDIDVPLPAGSGLHQWPVPIGGGGPDYTQFVNLTLEFIAPGVVGENAPSEFRASINGRPLVNTTFADIGVAPTGAGLAAQLPDFYSYDSESYGIVGCVRAGNGQTVGGVVQTFPVCFNEIEYIAGPFASTTLASP
jgi:hypothetical protein